MFYSIDLMTFCGSSEPKLTSTVILKRAFDNFSLKYSSYFHKNTNTGRENYLNLYQINSSTPLVNPVSHATIPWTYRTWNLVFNILFCMRTLTSKNSKCLYYDAFNLNKCVLQDHVRSTSFLVMF